MGIPWRPRGQAAALPLQGHRLDPRSGSQDPTRCEACQTNDLKTVHRRKLLLAEVRLLVSAGGISESDTCLSNVAPRWFYFPPTIENNCQVFP